jgi:uncharacterized membrane protein YfcA
MMLVQQKASSFEHIVPVFMALACILLAGQPYLHRTLYKKRVLSKHHLIAVSLMAIVFFFLSAYGGYFGAGFGIIVLALLGLTPIKGMQGVNGLKNLTGLSVGVVDCTYFAIHHLIDWPILPLFLIGNLVGGYAAALYGRKVPAQHLRFVIIAISVGVTALTFWKFY